MFGGFLSIVFARKRQSNAELGDTRIFDIPKTGLAPNPKKVLLYGLGTMLIVAGLMSGSQSFVTAFIVLSVVFEIGRGIHRSKAIERFAKEIGAAYFVIGRLPADFPILQTSSRRAHSISRVVNGGDLLIFDCLIPEGRKNQNRTILATRGDLSIFGLARFGPDLENEQVGEWAIVYGSRFLTIHELRALIAELSHFQQARQITA